MELNIYFYDRLKEKSLQQRDEESVLAVAVSMELFCLAKPRMQSHAHDEKMHIIELCMCIIHS